MNIDSVRDKLHDRLASALQAADIIRAAIALVEEVVADAGETVSVTKEKEEASSSADPLRTTGYQPGAVRPAHAPPNDAMFAAVLAKARREGVDGLTSAQIVEAIRGAYWPGVASCQILPALHLAAKKGKVAKSADGLFRPRYGGLRNKKAARHPSMLAAS